MHVASGEILKNNNGLQNNNVIIISQTLSCSQHRPSNWKILRTVTPFATAHTFCASRDVLRSSLLIKGHFCTVYNCTGKADLRKRHRYPERKLGVTLYFSEIIDAISCFVF